MSKRVQALWETWHPAETPKRLAKNGLPGVDLLVLDSESEIRTGDELEALYLKTYDAASQLEKELIEIVEAAEFEKESRNAIKRLVKELAAAQRAHGRVAAQFELLAADQYFNTQKAKKSANSNPTTIEERRRVKFITEWKREEISRGRRGTGLPAFKRWLAARNIQLNTNFSHKTWLRSKAKAEKALAE